MKNKLLKAAIAAIALTIAVGPAVAKKGSKGDYRSAKSGKYVKKGYADKNKTTTVREERKKN